MDFVKQEIIGEPEAADVCRAITTYKSLYGDKIAWLTKLYKNYIGEEALFNLYKRGMDNVTIEKLRFPLARYITTILSNYMLGKQPVYGHLADSPNEVAAVVDETERLYRKQSKTDLDKEIKRQCGKTGFAYELVFYDSDTLTPKSIQLPVDETCVVFDYGVELNSIYAVHWVRKDKKGYIVSVCTSEEIIEYETRSLSQSASWREINRVPHFMGRVPITMYLNNGDGIGDYEDVAPLIDALNGIATDERYDIKRNVDALLLFINTKLSGKTEAEKAKVRDAMRMLGILEINDDPNNPQSKADVKTLTSTLNLTSVQDFVKFLWTAIFKLSGVPDPTQTEYFTSLSGVALKMQMFLGLEPMATNTEGKFDYAFRRRFKMYNHFYAIRGRAPEIDVGEITIAFKHTVPTNDLEIAQMVSLLYGKPLISNETLTKQFSFVEDAKAENERAAAEATSEASDMLLAQLAGFGTNGGSP